MGDQSIHRKPTVKITSHFERYRRRPGSRNIMCPACSTRQPTTEPVTDEDLAALVVATVVRFIELGIVDASITCGGCRRNLIDIRLPALP